MFCFLSRLVRNIFSPMSICSPAYIGRIAPGELQQQHPSCFLLPALSLRNPLTVPSSYQAAFNMAHASINGEMASSGAYASLHLMSPQLNGAAVVGSSSYGRSPLVSLSGELACTKQTEREKYWLFVLYSLWFTQKGSCLS